MVAASQVEDGQDSSCPPVVSDTRPYWARKHGVQGARQRVFMKQLLGHRTCVTVRSSPRQDDQKPELGKLLRWPCRDSSGFLNLHGITAQSLQQVPWRPLKHRFLGNCLILLYL